MSVVRSTFLISLQKENKICMEKIENKRARRGSANIPKE